MAKPLLPGALWECIEPLLHEPKKRHHRFPGRKPVEDRNALTGILFVLKTGIPWEDLPQEMGCGSGMTCWRRLRDWQEAGVWQRLHEQLLAGLNGADRIDWSRASVDSRSLRALGGGEKTGPSPVDRRKKGSKDHIIVDGHGIPRAETLTAANARTRTAHGSGLAKVRWVVERTLGWLAGKRKIRIRTERRAGTHEGVLSLAPG